MSQEVTLALIGVLATLVTSLTTVALAYIAWRTAEGAKNVAQEAVTVSAETKDVAREAVTVSAETKVVAEQAVAVGQETHTLINGRIDQWSAVQDEAKDAAIAAALAQGKLEGRAALLLELQAQAVQRAAGREEILREQGRVGADVSRRRALSRPQDHRGDEARDLAR